jgi:23S rRNA (uridine2552-2'-O)-methyltransferase
VRLERLADALEPGIARRAVVGEGLHLDQLVRLQRALDLREHLLGEAVVADQDHGLQLVRLAAQFTAAGCGEGKRSHRRIIAMKKSHSSKQWLRRHVNDPYVQRARKEGYRSRSAYKLTEIDERDKLLKPGMVVVDLGSAPGGWSQVLAKRARSDALASRDGLAGREALIVAIDLLEMEPITGVTFVRGDFSKTDGLTAVAQALGGRKADLVLSDLSPNLTGIPFTDQARSMELTELAFEFALKHLKSEGVFLVKVFQGVGYQEFVKTLRQAFDKVVVRKPAASRDESAEQYLLARGFKSKALIPGKMPEL